MASLVVKWTQPRACDKPPQIKNHSATLVNGKLLVFGGFDGRRNHNTVHLLDTTTLRWNTATVGGTPPPGRNGHTATLVDGRLLFVIGGWLGHGPQAAEDCHILDVDSMVWSTPTVKGAPPGPCNMHTADFVEAHRGIFLFRGGDGIKYLSQLHVLQVDTMSWTTPATTGTAPLARANHGSALYKSKLFIFGGWDGNKRLNDVYALDTDVMRWEAVNVSGVPPCPRAGMTLSCVRDKFYLFGGSGPGARCFNDLQIFDPATSTWLPVAQRDESDRSGSRHHAQHPRQQRQQRQHRAGALVAGGGGAGGGAGAGSSAGDGGSGSGSGSGVGATPSVVLRGLNRSESKDADLEDVGPGEEEGEEAVPDGAHGDSMLGRSGGGMGVGGEGSDGGGGGGGGGGYYGSHMSSVGSAGANPNTDEEELQATVVGPVPGTRAGHTSTVFGRKLLVFGGSCASEYPSNTHILDTDPKPSVVVTCESSSLKMRRSLQQFVNNPQFADVVFVVEGRKVYAHRVILSLVSDKFQAMFGSRFREATQREILVPDKPYSVFVALLEYLYTGQSPPFGRLGDPDHDFAFAVELLKAADEYIVDRLRQECEQFLAQSVREDTVAFLTALADSTNSTQLMAQCQYFARNCVTHTTAAGGAAGGAASGAASMAVALPAAASASAATAAAAPASHLHSTSYRIAGSGSTAHDSDAAHAPGSAGHAAAAGSSHVSVGAASASTGTASESAADSAPSGGRS